MSDTSSVPKTPFAQPQAATPVNKPTAQVLAKPVAAPAKKPGRPKGAKNRKVKAAPKGAKTSVIGQVVADVLSCVEGLTPSDKAKVLKIVAKI